ncbi:MAG: MBL fold metallo-hydrolase, partial [Burkholderiales bacterium]|nr:MBL fold metallo-hydrolase [Burkholderiales bacterium]
EAWAPILAAHAPITRILVTHYHPDHVGLAGWLSQYTDGGIWMTEAEYLTAHAVWDDAAGYGADALARLFTAHGLDADNVAAVSTRGNGYRRSVAPVPTTFHRITHGDTLDVGGRAWNVIVGHGHAPEHASLHCAELGVVISGDMLLPRISTNTSVWATEPEGDPVGQFLRSIRAYNALPADTLVLPSHGLPFRGAHARVAALETHHADRLAELLAACTGTPKTAAEILPVLFRRTLDHHQIYFAMGEAIAHLNHLLGHERLQRLLGADGIHRFIAR